MSDVPAAGRATRSAEKLPVRRLVRQGETMPRNPDRRRARSADPLVALSRSLAGSLDRSGIAAIVLADASGITIAGAGPAAQCDELAARAAVLVGRHAANDTVPCRLDIVTRAFAVRRLRIDGIEVLLCAEGDPAAREQPLLQAAAACQRILARRLETGSSEATVP